MQRLPTELTDIIIDFLHSNKRALNACSLVCRNWLPASRFHLLGTTRVRYTNVEPFVNLLSLASCRSSIARHIHTLDIDLQKVVGKPPIFDNIAPYLEHLIAIQSFSMRGWQWVPINEENLSRAYGRFGHMELTKVFRRLVDCRFALTFTIGDRGPSSFSSSLRVLQAIIGSRSSVWLPKVAQLPAVGQLGLSGFREGGLSTVRAALKSGGQSVHTIKLDFSRSRSVSALISDCVDLTHNTNLRSLSINNLDLRHSGEIAGDTFLKIVQRISSPFFSHIEIRVWVDSCMDLAWLDCGKLADELNHPRFSDLRKVCVVIWCVSDKKNGVVGWVCREMSSLDNRGILTVRG